ncbi:MAG TPA: OB-fold domain-containing protein, partial [Acidimicrobiales bacterium]|nr:OB-fold domain-containing protein [Acidimicrobiales bacterium]
WFATATPAYLDKTNAATVHAALQLPVDVPAFDFGGALRSGTGALQAALSGGGTVLVVAADQRDGLPTSADESSGGDGAAALVVGDGSEAAPMLAEHLGGATATDEFVDRWRAPGQSRSRTWEERFGETRYVALGRDAWDRALKDVGLTAGDVDRVAVSGMHSRAVKAVAAKLGLADGALADDFSGTVGQTGTAHPLLLLASMLEAAASSGGGGGGEVVALVHLADGADVQLFRTTDAIAGWRPATPVTAQVAAGAEVGYGKFLSWRGMTTVEPPRRPEPSRVSSTAAWRNEDWKFGFVGSRDRSSGAIHLPPSRVSMVGGAVDEMEPAPMADAIGTVVTFTIDHMAYSPSPPTVFAVVDFDGGGRFPLELTDVDADELAIGDRVTMTFRRLFTADGIHDYFWKAVPRRDGAGKET